MSAIPSVSHHMSTYPTCDSCRHWGQEGEPGFFRCENAKLNGDLKKSPCELIPQDAEGYKAWVETGPKFGCIHHEPK